MPGPKQTMNLINQSQLAECGTRCLIAQAAHGGQPASTGCSRGWLLHLQKTGRAWLVNVSEPPSSDVMLHAALRSNSTTTEYVDVAAGLTRLTAGQKLPALASKFPLFLKVRVIPEA